MEAQNRTEAAVPRRRAPRYRVRLPVRFRTGDDAGKGVVVSMSARGGKIESADVAPDQGTPVVLNVYLAPASEPLRVVGEVVGQRHQDGFAVEFRVLDPATLRFIGIVLSQLGVPVPGRAEDRCASVDEAPS